MKSSVLLSKENYFLVLDIYLGGVSGAIVKNGIIEYTSHHTTAKVLKNKPHEFLAEIETLLHKTIEQLVSKKKISKTYFFIDAPLSYSESHEVLFQDKDATFFEQNQKEIEAHLDIPDIYKKLLNVHTADGVVIEHAPQRHTINGYRTSNLTLPGEKKAQVTQQWIQRNVYSAIQKIKQLYSLGKEVFLPDLLKEKNSEALLMLGDVISVYHHRQKQDIFTIGTKIAMFECAQKENQSFLELESILTSIDRGHASKNSTYKELVKKFNHVFFENFKKYAVSNDVSMVFVGDSFMLPIIKDVFAVEKKVHFTKIYTGKDARLMYIVKNKVE